MVVIGMMAAGGWSPRKWLIIIQLKPGQKVLDVGCGKAHLLYELTQVVPGLEVAGIDISSYAIDHAKEEVRPFLRQGLAQDLPYADHSFDLVFSLNTLHNLAIFDLKKAIQHITRVSRKNSYVVVESYRNEREKVNLLYWQLTCEAFFSVAEWEWLYTNGAIPVITALFFSNSGGFMKVMITGVGGYIGSYLATKWQERSYSIIGIAKKSNFTKYHFPVIYGDIADGNLISRTG